MSETNVMAFFELSNRSEVNRYIVNRFYEQSKRIVYSSIPQADLEARKEYLHDLYLNVDKLDLIDTFDLLEELTDLFPDNQIKYSSIP